MHTLTPKPTLSCQLWQDWDHQLLEETKAWLESLYKASIPICLCSEMDAASLQSSLKKMGVGEIADQCVLVTAEDDVDTRAQMYLTSALKLNRPPEFCVVFDNDPEGISSAHDISALVWRRIPSASCVVLCLCVCLFLPPSLPPSLSPPPPFPPCMHALIHAHTHRSWPYPATIRPGL